MSEHQTFWKPTKRRAVVKREKRAANRRTRAQVRAEVWRRAKGLCQRCGKKCIPPKETYPTDPDMGEVNEPEGRVKGAAYDPGRCELICHGCHQPGGQHAPTLARQRVLEGKAPGKSAVRRT